MSKLRDVIYKIDANDRIVSVNDEWIAFALENAGDRLLPTEIEGKTIWEFICDATTTLIYQAMIHKVRLGSPAIRFSFRCDSSDRRRLMQMEISLTSSNVVRFRCTPLAIQQRPPVNILDVSAPRSEEALVVCGWCKQFRTPDKGWLEIEAAVEHMDLFHRDLFPELSHGMCSMCYASTMAILES